MLTIQDVGQQILLDNPQKFYVMCGPEYGIKMMYVNKLKSHYGRLIESESIDQLIQKMKTKRLIPEPPAVYVVRYDDSFISSLNEKTLKTIEHLNINGTIVCIYDNEKYTSKLDKYLGKFSVYVDHVHEKYISKYLHNDFPDLPDRYIDVATHCSEDYNQANLICQCMSCIPRDKQNDVTDSDLMKFFKLDMTSTEDQIQLGVAARDVSYLIHMFEIFDGEADTILYSILSTLVKLDQLITTNRTSSSELGKFVKSWTPQDVYYMFMNTYDLLYKFRTSQPANVMDSVIQLVSLLAFDRIPSPEVLK